MTSEWRAELCRESTLVRVVYGEATPGAYHQSTYFTVYMPTLPRVKPGVGDA